jgi:3,4-dihydroxy 2-butanone 4-phosphate synthase/GTP cyclohydrolase II
VAPVDGTSLIAEAADHLRRYHRPLVTLSYAQSIDGSISIERGRSAALSGTEAMRITHELRSANQAILVGIGTVLADDPLLTVRHASGPSPQPVVLDASLQIPSASRLLRENPRPPWIMTGQPVDGERRSKLEALGAVVEVVGRGEDGLLEPAEVLERLGARGISSLMIEGGARVITSFLARGLVDRIAVTIVPLYIGGYHAVSGVAGRGGLPRIVDTRVVRAGEDYVLYGRVSR